MRYFKVESMIFVKNILIITDLGEDFCSLLKSLKARGFVPPFASMPYFLDLLLPEISAQLIKIAHHGFGSSQCLCLSITAIFR